MVLGLIKESIQYEERYKNKLIELAKNQEGWFSEYKMKQELINLGLPVETLRQRVLAQSLFNKLLKGMRYHETIHVKDYPLEDIMDQIEIVKVEISGTSFKPMMYRLNYEIHYIPG